MRDIEFLTDPGSGEVSVGADMSYIAGGFMSAIIERLSERHPRLAVHVVETRRRLKGRRFANCAIAMSMSSWGVCRPRSLTTT
jgi:hypothetical protein